MNEYLVLVNFGSWRHVQGVHTLASDSEAETLRAQAEIRELSAYKTRKARGGKPPGAFPTVTLWRKL